VQKILRKRVFPIKPGKKRQRGVQKPGVGFRAPDDIVEWLAELEQAGADKTEAIVTSLRLGREVAKRIGDKWYEVEYRAKRQGVEPGTMLADLALAAIASDGIPAPKPPKK